MGCGREGVIGVVWCVMKGLVCVCVVCVHTSRGVFRSGEFCRRTAAGGSSGDGACKRVCGRVSFEYLRGGRE